MVKPQGSRAKEDKKKTKSGRRGWCEGGWAKIGPLIEDSSWSLSHCGWAELACSDFRFIHAKHQWRAAVWPFAESLSGEQKGGRMEEARDQGQMMGGWIFFLICPRLLCAPWCFWSYIMCVFTCLHIHNFVCLYVWALWSWQTLCSLHIYTQTHTQKHWLQASNTSNESYFIDLMRKTTEEPGCPPGEQPD